MDAAKVAVVGVGALGEHHARIYSELPEAELIAVVDTHEGRAEQIASLYGCEAHRRYEDVLSGVDAVSLAVPTSAHAQIGAACLRSGVHVLVEKPIAESRGQADQLIEARDECGKILLVGHTERFNPALLAVRPHITRPRFFEAHRLGVFVPRSLDIDVVLDLMIHDLDLILHLVDSPVREIRAVGIPVLTPRIDIANARLEFENGCVANVTASRVSKEKIRKLRFFQPHDYVSIDLHDQDVEMYSLLGQDAGMQITERKLEIHHQEPLEAELKAFLQAVQSGTFPASSIGTCSAEEGRSALALALDLKRAMGETMPPDPLDTTQS